MLLKLVFLAINFGFFVPGPQSKLMEDNTCCDWHIQTGSLVCILRYVNKKVAKLSVDRNDSGTFVSQKECSITRKRMFLNRHTTLSNLYSANSDIVSVQILFCFFKISKTIEIYLLESSMVAKNMKLFHGFHLFAIIRFVGHINYLFETKGACTSNYVSDVVFLADIV